MSISVPGKGLQNTRQIETVLKLAVEDLGAFTMQMTVTGVLGSFRQRDSGQQRWMSGDREFDHMVDVRTSDGVKLAMLLGAEGQRIFADLLQGSKATIYVAKGTIAYTELGLIADGAVRERFEKAAEVLCDFAETLES